LKNAKIRRSKRTLWLPDSQGEAEDTGVSRRRKKFDRADFFGHPTIDESSIRHADFRHLHFAYLCLLWPSLRGNDDERASAFSFSFSDCHFGSVLDLFVAAGVPEPLAGTFVQFDLSFLNVCCETDADE
jgi:hypothetical protein